MEEFFLGHAVILDVFPPVGRACRSTIREAVKKYREVSA